MVTRAVSAGRGIGGLMSYLMHDKVTPGDRYPTTAERVAWAVPIGGSPTADVDLSVRIMQGVTADAAILKQLSGASNRGRKLRNPYAHFMTSWPPGETPSREEMLEAAGGQLDALGCADRVVIVVAHTDTEHHHFHLVVCKVHPETGKAASLDHSGLKLSRFAEQWERDHGGIVIENRVRRNEARAARAAYVDRYMEQHYKPDPNASLGDQAAHYDEILKKARAEARELHRLPPMEPKRSRNVDGQPVKTPEPERQFWSELHEKQRAENLPEPDQRQQRVEASRLLRHGPAPRVDQEPEVTVPGVPAQAFPAPSRAVRVGREPEVTVPGVPAQAFPAPSRAVRVGREPEVTVPGVPAQAFPAPSRAVRVGREPEVTVPGVPAQAFPAPSRAVRVGREPEVTVPAAPEQPCPIPVRDTAVQVLADLGRMEQERDREHEKRSAAVKRERAAVDREKVAVRERDEAVTQRDDARQREPASVAPRADRGDDEPFAQLQGVPLTRDAGRDIGAERAQKPVEPPRSGPPRQRSGSRASR